VEKHLHVPPGPIRRHLASASFIKGALVRNSPADRVPYWVMPAAEMSNWPVADENNRDTTA
jgi:hypothetical protein